MEITTSVCIYNNQSSGYAQNVFSPKNMEQNNFPKKYCKSIGLYSTSFSAL